MLCQCGSDWTAWPHPLSHTIADPAEEPEGRNAGQQNVEIKLDYHMLIDTMGPVHACPTALSMAWARGEPGGSYSDTTNTSAYIVRIMKKLMPTLRPLNLYAALVTIGALCGLQSVQAGYLLEIDTDGADDGVLTYNPNFSFGGDTTTASQSAPSSAFGMTGGDSIFGGDGSAFVDTYVYSYDPSSQADNLAIPGGTDLGGGVLASGLSGGAPGVYAVFATWPFTQNVNGGDTTFTATTAGDSFVMSLDQNAGGAGSGNTWIKLGEINWTGGAITLSQEAGSNTFVSMRAAGVLFEVVPEPSVFALSSFGLLALMAARGRRAGS